MDPNQNQPPIQPTGPTPMPQPEALPHLQTQTPTPQQPQPIQPQPQPQPQVNFQQPIQVVQQPQTNKNDVLGIISIVIAVVMPILGLLGLILGIIGIRKAKKEGYSSVLSIIGVVLNTIIGLIIAVSLSALFLLSSNIVVTGQDIVAKNDINSIYQKLEEYYNVYGGYPDGELSSSLLPGIDPEAFIDEFGQSISYEDGFTTSLIAPLVEPNADKRYIYIAYGCDSEGPQSPVGSSCKKYILATYLESEIPAVYSKMSLN